MAPASDFRYYRQVYQDLMDDITEDDVIDDYYDAPVDEEAGNK